MPRGVKPKPLSNCEFCNKYCRLKRGFCDTCYARKLRKGEIQPLIKENLPDLNEHQLQMLCGSMLGDGCIYKDKPSHQPYFLVQRSLKDEQYSLWQTKIIERYISRVSVGETFDKRTDRNYEWIKFTTRRTKAFEQLYQDWYPSGKKIVSSNVKLTPLSLSVWFADDGYVRSLHVPWRLQLKFSTHGFELQDVEFLSSKLCERYKEYFGITLEGSEKKPIIYASDSATRAFLAEIDCCFPEAMNRKAHWRKPEVCFYNNQPKKSKNQFSLQKSTQGIRNDSP